MKFKLDECVDARLSINLEEAGYEVVTTRQQGLHGIDGDPFVLLADALSNPLSFTRIEFCLHLDTHP